MKEANTTAALNVEATHSDLKQVPLSSYVLVAAQSIQMLHSMDTEGAAFLVTVQQFERLPSIVAVPATYQRHSLASGFRTEANILPRGISWISNSIATPLTGKQYYICEIAH